MLASAFLAGCVASSNTTASSFNADQSRASGLVQPGPSQPLSGGLATVSGNAYRVGPFDVLDISVFQVPELTKSVQVADTGTINLPLIGEVVAAGKTPSEVERDITSRLGAKYLRNPQVTVYVKEYNSQSITISGAVKNPGVYPMKGRVSLLQAVAMAGDVQPDADSNVLVLRESGGKRMAAKFNLSAIQKGEADDPALQGGDRIVAGTSAIKKGFNAILKAVPLVGTFALL